MVTLRCSHNAHILMPSTCQSLCQNKGCVGQDKARGPTQTISSSFFCLKEHRKQNRETFFSLSKRRFKSQSEARQSGLRNPHFKTPSDPLYYIPPKGCNTAAIISPSARAHREYGSDMALSRVFSLGAGQVCQVNDSKGSFVSKTSLFFSTYGSVPKLKTP